MDTNYGHRVSGFRYAIRNVRFARSVLSTYVSICRCVRIGATKALTDQNLLETLKLPFQELAYADAASGGIILLQCILSIDTQETRNACSVTARQSFPAKPPPKALEGSLDWPGLLDPHAVALML